MSVAASVNPRVNDIASLAGTIVLYAIYCLFEIASPACRIATLYSAAAASRLQTFNVLHTALLPAGTVYNVVFVVALGFDCPKILYVIAIICPYIPASKNGCRSPGLVAAVAAIIDVCMSTQ